MFSSSGHIENNNRPYSFNIQVNNLNIWGLRNGQIHIKSSLQDKAYMLPWNWHKHIHAYKDHSRQK